MTRHPEWFTPSMRAAADRGYARAVADVAAAQPDLDPETTVEDPVDVAVDVASVIASTREQLALHEAAATSLVDVAVTGDRL